MLKRTSRVTHAHKGMSSRQLLRRTWRRISRDVHPERPRLRAHAAREAHREVHAGPLRDTKQDLEEEGHMSTPWPVLASRAG